MSLFKGKDDVIEDIEFVEVLNETRNVIRRARFRLLSTSIIYNEEEHFYYTVATCINENNKVETIGIEGFGIQENVMDFKGTYIDYEEYEENSEMNYIGTIKKASV